MLLSGRDGSLSHTGWWRVYLYRVCGEVPPEKNVSSLKFINELIVKQKNFDNSP